MSECTNCGYFLEYPDRVKRCLMRQRFCIVEGKTSYPKNCEYYKRERGLNND